ncbi:MAG: hypothetical protein K8R46_11475, partial [Pirellulales bacterium]|nr:hypothetical protein [Pirellulales bacterium]
AIRASSLADTALYVSTGNITAFAGYFKGGKNYFEGNVGIGTTSSPYSLSIRSTSSHRSIYAFNQYSGSEDKFGIYCLVNSNGTGEKCGLLSQVEGNPSENNPLYGVYTYTNDNGNSGNTYGLYSYLTATGTGDHYAIYASTNDGWAGYFEGGQNYFEGNVGIGTMFPAYPLDIYTDSKTISLRISNQYDGSSDKYGMRCNLNPDGTGNRYGIYSNVNANPSDSSASYGAYINTDANNSPGSVYGLYSNLTNTNNGSRYGVYSVVKSGSTNNYAIYGKAPGGWAGYFPNGNVYIAEDLRIGATTSVSGYKVSVDGRIICEELNVQASTAWPDYVFDKNYPLIPIKELEKSILKTKHLPGMPSAQTVNEKGITLGEMTIKHTEKIEELTLYIIELNKRMEKLEKENKRTRGTH